MSDNVTMKDVAAAAGVSVGTVSNVIKGDRRVNLSTVQRVQTAIRETGYRVHVQPRNNSKTRKSRLMGIVLPSVTDSNFAHIYSGAEHQLGENGYTGVLCTTSEIQAKEQRAIEQLIKQKVEGLIIVTCQPGSSAMFRSLIDNGTPIVFAEREPVGGGFPLVEYNYADCMARLTRSLLAKGHHDILLITGPLDDSCEAAYAKGFLAALNSAEADPGKLVIETNFNKESAFSAAVVRLKGMHAPDVIITTSRPLFAGAQKAVKLLFPDDKPEFVSLGESSWAPSDLSGITVIRRDAKELGKKAADLLLGIVENTNNLPPGRRIVINIPPSDKEPEPKAKSKRLNLSAKPLRVLLLGGASSTALELMLPAFVKSTGFKVDITNKSILEISSIFRSPAERSAYDIFQVDQPWLGEAASENFLLNLDDWLESRPELTADWLPGVMDTYCRFAGHYYAMPFLFGAQLLFYRKDLFDDPYLRSSFRKRERCELRAPRNWQEFNQIARFFTRELNPESPTPYGTTLGGQAPNGAICEFLPRLLAFSERQLVAENMLESLASPAAEAALQNYIESYRYAAPGSGDHWWDDQLRIFIQGDAAMMILFLGHVSQLSDRQKSKVVGRVGYGVIPGGMPMLGGWTLGINRGSKRLSLAKEFLAWVCDRDMMIPFTILGGSPPSSLVYGSSEVSSLYPWLPTAVESFSRSQWRTVSKVTTCGRVEERVFEEILGGAVHAAICGTCTPAEALESARLSLGRLVTV